MLFKNNLLELLQAQITLFILFGYKKGLSMLIILSTVSKEWFVIGLKDMGFQLELLILFLILDWNNTNKNKGNKFPKFTHKFLINTGIKKKSLWSIYISKEKESWTLLSLMLTYNLTTGSAKFNKLLRILKILLTIVFVGLLKPNLKALKQILLKFYIQLGIKILMVKDVL